MENKKFTLSDTNFIKGIAILMLLFHHLFSGVLIPPIIWSETSKFTIFATLSKVCVSLFLFLSGYGMTASYEKSEKTDVSFVFGHLFKLLKTFWFIYIIFTPLGFYLDSSPLLIYGDGFSGFKNFIFDFLGMSALFETPTMNQSWWYLEATIVFYILYPILYRICKKHPLTVTILSALPMLLYVYYSNYSWNNCREIFWFLPFVCGIIFHQKNTLTNFFECYQKNKISKLLSVTALTAVFLILRYNFGIILDTPLSISIIIFSMVTIAKLKFIYTPLKKLGEHSANIYMFHSFIYYNFSWAFWLYEIDNKIIRFFSLLVVCIIISIFIEFIKNFIFKMPKLFSENKSKSVVQ